MVRIAPIGIALVVGTALVACRPGGVPGTGGQSPSPEPSETPVVRVDIELGDADLVGTFGGDPQLEGGCAWLDADDGERYEVVYPEGWTVAFDPLALVDPSGQIRAEEGDRVGLNGEVERDAVSFCQIGPIFRATEVITGD